MRLIKIAVMQMSAHFESINDRCPACDMQELLCVLVLDTI